MKIGIFGIWLFITSTSAFATPAQVVLIRHGEKPVTGDEVNTQGCERAYSLPNFILKNSLIQQFGNPVVIYAMRPDSGDGSVRAIETLAPTADDLALPINANFGRLDFALVAQEIMSSPNDDHKTILIAWEHKVIPSFAEAFGVKLDPQNQTWPGNIFDEAWVIDFSSKPTLTIISESVLSTDNPKGGSDWQKGPTSTNVPAVPAAIANDCLNNDPLNALMKKWVTPALP